MSNVERWYRGSQSDCRENRKVFGGRPLSSDSLRDKPLFSLQDETGAEASLKGAATRVS